MSAVWKNKDRVSGAKSDDGPYIPSLIYDILSYGTYSPEERQIQFPQGWVDILRPHVITKWINIPGPVPSNWAQFDNEGELIHTVFSEHAVRTLLFLYS